MNYRITWLNYKGATATVQAGNSSTHHNAARTHRYPVNERVLQMAEAEYERQFGTRQTIDRLRERGGLGLGEMMTLLACAVERYAPPGALTPRSLTKEATS